MLSYRFIDPFVAHDPRVPSLLRIGVCVQLLSGILSRSAVFYSSKKIISHRARAEDRLFLSNNIVEYS